ncbi:2-polyprenyl-6-methoxyphenol hydroxylase [Mycolicibacterium rutilum]|uniref:2-polyprenyl-6-methoxyphenol hydroxylase n=1 Tax=Mycolicibacterium rutilum TaxID=370526 RepID=A0A1H6KQ64_MYCRU|nr:FAD-dependent oxidoreductase [Mycolicibacterium rutilum]SEH77942.1 2-polyprenyl-6-methoxyphenol hydroxylase [Mycolicibacterium rutilum]
MRIAVVGAGPAGLFSTLALARRGHRVTVVDRDPGPPRSGRWHRRAVMQFEQAHTFRRQVIDALAAELPDVLGELRAAGAVIARDGAGGAVGLLCSRATFDRVLWNCAAREPGVDMVTGNVDRVIVADGRAAGVTAGATSHSADLVVDASGRDSRFTRALRPPASSRPCGAAYVSRQYRLRPGTAAPAATTPFGTVLAFPRYWALAYLHDNAMFSVTLVHDGTDDRLRRLRHPELFETAVQRIPQLADWVDPARCRALSPPLPGGRLVNSYRGQLDSTGRPALVGLISVGDAVCTTTPLAGRGVALALLQARAMVGALDAHGSDIASATMAFDTWCETTIRPWYEDHCYADAARMRRWSGQDVDLGARLPSDLIVAAAGADAELAAVVAPYASMDALPASLEAGEPRARARYASGWRPAPPPGPTRDELIAVVSGVSRTPVSA